MKKYVALLVVIGLVALSLLFLNANIEDQNSIHHQTPTAYLAPRQFSEEANKIFISSVADHVNLNSGITMERAMPAYASQVNNITFAVFNHTNEPVIFPNQAFGLTVLKYNDTNKAWEILHLPYVPDSEVKVLPANLEKWDLEINNSWDILQNDATTFGNGQIRLYVAGQGKTTYKKYGAYLDISISITP